jgi:PAS domain S-box-containing protein
LPSSIPETFSVRLNAIAPDAGRGEKGKRVLFVREKKYQEDAMFFSSQNPLPDTTDDPTSIGKFFPSELRWQIIEQSSDCIKVLDLDGLLLYMNRGGQKTMEIDDFSICRLTGWLTFWEGEGFQTAQEALTRAHEGQETTFEAPTPTAKGTPKWWEVTVSPILDTEGQVTHILAISRDITARKQVEEERTGSG